MWYQLSWIQPDNRMVIRPWKFPTVSHRRFVYVECWSFSIRIGLHSHWYTLVCINAERTTLSKLRCSECLNGSHDLALDENVWFPALGNQIKLERVFDSLWINDYSSSCTDYILYIQWYIWCILALTNFHCRVSVDNERSASCPMSIQNGQIDGKADGGRTRTDKKSLTDGRTSHLT